MSDSGISSSPVPTATNDSSSAQPIFRRWASNALAKDPSGRNGLKGWPVSGIRGLNKEQETEPGNDILVTPEVRGGSIDTGGCVSEASLFANGDDRISVRRKRSVRFATAERTSHEQRRSNCFWIDTGGIESLTDEEVEKKASRRISSFREVLIGDALASINSPPDCVSGDFAYELSKGNCIEKKERREKNCRTAEQYCTSRVWVKLLLVWQSTNRMLDILSLLGDKP